MLTYILLATILILVFVAGGVIVFGKFDAPDAAGVLLFCVGIPLLIVSIIFINTWSHHASDLGIVYAQDLLVEVHRERVADIKSTLHNIKIPPSALLNADTPMAALVSALHESEKVLTLAASKKAQAIISIEKRRRGPYSGLITIFGDYK